MIASCPQCDQQVTVPSSADQGTRVRCPLCQEEYLLEAVYEKLPPMLEIIEVPAVASLAGEEMLFEEAAASPAAAGLAAGLTEAAVSPSVDAEPATETVETAEEAPIFGAPVSDTDEGLGELADTAEFEEVGEAASDEGLPALGEPEEVSGPSPFDFGDAEGPVDASAPTATVASRARPKKAKKSHVGEIIKVAGGGIAGLLIAQAILWWLPGSWKRDPAKLAPKLPSFVAFLAPAELRGTAPKTDDDQGQPPEKSNNGKQRPKSPKDASETNGQGEGNGKTPGPDTSGSFADVGLNKLDQPGGDGPDDGSSPKAGNGKRPQKGPRGEDGNEDPFGRGETEPVIEPVLGVIDPPSYSGADLGEALVEASQANQDWDEQGASGDRRALAKQFYTSLCQLGETTTFADQDDKKIGGRMEAVQNLLRDVGRDQAKVSLIGKAAASWMGSDKRDKNGVLLCGKVTEIAPHGELYETRLQLASKQELVSVLSQSDPTDNPWQNFQEGDEVLILGSIVDDPSLKLAGYQGADPKVVWGGFVAIIPQ